MRVDEVWRGKRVGGEYDEVGVVGVANDEFTVEAKADAEGVGKEGGGVDVEEGAVAGQLHHTHVVAIGDVDVAYAADGDATRGG